MNVCPWQPAAIQSNRGTKLIEILRLSHKGNREIKSNVYPLARITNKLSVRSFDAHPEDRALASVKSTLDSRLLSTPWPSPSPCLNSKFEIRARRSVKFSQNEDYEEREHGIRRIFYALAEEIPKFVRYNRAFYLVSCTSNCSIWFYLRNTSRSSILKVTRSIVF